ncbi:ABC transporter permease [Piscirickettsia litoralis]|uniref:Peptide ABC transporter permease n=1 Tax=Piscirickettsia litoralis TaxID=1891921 RepID=A0ABX3A849_9GAMM|nr:ABC transporter permease [Piscirickettsia litoralis]ODN43615.1 peptide ABC transporter permease [Piscirickettsia litoralis]
MAYVLRSILYMIPTILLGTLLVFLILYLSPGNYVTFLQATNPHFTATQLNEMTAELGLNQPWWQQYLHWLWNVFHGDLGRSYLYNETVIKLVWPRMLNSFVIIALSTFFIYLFGFLIGIYSATNRGRFTERFVNATSYIFVGIPSFFLALLFIYLIVLLKQKYDIAIPLHGMTSDNYQQLSFIGKVVDILKHVIFPSIVASLVSIAFISRLVRTQMLEFLHHDFVRTARAKGASETSVVYKHTLKNAILPFISDIGGFLSGLISGAGLIEVVFNYPGLTPLFLQAIYAKDTPVIAGITLLSMLILVIGNILGDLLLTWFDPRVNYQVSQ